MGMVPAKAVCGVTRGLLLGCFLLTGACGHAAKHPTAKDPALLPLTTVAQVRALTSEQAALLVPVKISGIVTAMPGYRNSFFVQDSTAGISVDRTDHAEVHTGDRVELTGTSGPGLFAPVVLASYVRVTGHGPPPNAPLKTLGDLFGGLQDSQWIELRGVVRSTGIRDLFGRPALLLGLELDGGLVTLQVQNPAGMDGKALIDSLVRVRGVCTSSGNDKRQFVGSMLMLPNPRDLVVEQQAPKDPFAAPARPIRDILKFGQWQHRVKVVGTVTEQIPGEAIYLQDGEDGIRVQSQSGGIVPVGAMVEAVGFPGMEEYAPALESGLFRVIGQGAPMSPKRIKAADVITLREGFNRASYDQQLVQLKATLLEDHVQGGEHIWIMQEGKDVFEVRLRLSSEDRSMRPIPPGSVMQLTGICMVHVGPILDPISFTILLRSPADIVVLRTGPWWTRDRALLLVAAFATVMLLVLLWVGVLRNRVEEQTRTIRASEDRFRYLAEHDPLTGMLNRRAILQALERQLVQGSRENKTVTVVLCDIDHFKEVNDAHGHLAGDEALRRFAEAAMGCIRPYDRMGRYGGEEFLLVLAGIPEQDIEERLHVLHGAMSNLTVLYEQTEFRITCSLGAVLLDGEEQDRAPEAMLAAADRALYQAKEAGRNRVVVAGWPLLRLG
jgi:diguanylate cyclase (GGDEF)-like protein